MDHADHDRGRIALDALPGRVRELSLQLARGLRLARPKESLARKLKAASFVLLAILFGTIAHRLNREETEIQWRKSHLPSAAIWKAGFAAEGFREITDPLLLAKLTRRLPSLADTTGEIWKANPDWWVVDADGAGGDSASGARGGGAPLVFCSRCELKPPPTSWSPAGSGWEGWESAMKAAREEAQRLRSSIRPAKRRGEAIDPREIRY